MRGKKQNLLRARSIRTNKGRQGEGEGKKGLIVGLDGRLKLSQMNVSSFLFLSVPIGLLFAVSEGESMFVNLFL